MSRRPRVKICGVTTAEDARLAAGLGAELIGLNFYPDSPRFLEPERAAELVREVATSSVRWVGVFVNETAERAAAIAERVGLDLLQFHGDETPADLAGVEARSIKALRVRGDLSGEVLAPWLDRGLWGLLVDARHDTLYGGSGRSWNFASAAAAPAAEAGAPRLLIAGGLGPSSAAAAARAARPWGLDLCSGVEAEPGRKDPALMRRLFTQLDEEIPHGETPSAA